MKICYFVNQYPKVSHTFIRREILALETLGASVVRIAARNSPEELVDETDKRELAKTRCIAMGNKKSLLKSGFKQLVKDPVGFFKAAIEAIKLGFNDQSRYLYNFVYLLEACELLRICEEQQVDHVHAHFGTNSTSVVMLCRLLGGPKYSFTVHGPEEFDKPIQLSLGKKIENSAFVVAITSFCRSQLMRWCSFEHWKKITIVHCAVDDELLTKPHMPISSTNRFINIGRLSEQKGQLLLVEAMALLKERGVSAHISLIGDGDLRTEIERTIAVHGLEEYVSLLGWRSTAQIIEELDNGSALVLPSFAEGLPVSIMEACARKRPILTTYIAGIPELIDENSGWLIPAGDANAIADAIENITQHSLEQLTALGEYGFQRVSEEHDSVREAQKLLDAIKSLED